jgi:twitching motility protein PilT
MPSSLRGVVSQQLIPTTNNQGRVAALEILINTPAVANLIRQGKMDQLENAMQSGAASGMRLMDTAIQTLLEQRQISGKEAYKKAINKSRFEQYRNAS